MIRFTMAASFHLLLVSLASPVAIGQETSKPAPPAVSPLPVSRFYQDYRAAIHQAIQSKAVAKVPDALEANFGLSLADADDTLRAQLEIPTGEGVVVVGVKQGSLAEQAGVKLNDVFLKLGDQMARAADQVRQILLGLGKQALEVKLIREGKPRRMSLVGPEHGFPPDAAEFWLGVPVSPVDPTLRSHLPTLPADSGLIVNDVVKGSPADQAGVKKDDVLITLDRKPLSNSDALIAQIQASKGKTVPLELLRAGKPLTLAVTPAKRAHPTVINVKESNPSTLTYQVVRPSMAIAVEPRETAGAIRPAPALNLILDDYNENTSYTFFATGAAAVAPATARIEGQLKEVMTKLDEISKALEASRKPALK